MIPQCPKIEYLSTITITKFRILVSETFLNISHREISLEFKTGIFTMSISFCEFHSVGVATVPNYQKVTKTI